MQPNCHRRRTLRASLAALLVLAVSNATLADTIDDVDDKPDAWFTSDEGRQILDNVLSWQQPTGGWWKSYDVKEHRPASADPGHDGRSIFDNKATWTEMRVLARAFQLTGEPNYRDAFERALQATFDAQYANGGFPQEFPPPQDGYANDITYNDDAMANVLRLLRDVGDGREPFGFVEDARRSRARTALQKGIQCVLDTQIKIDGKRTVWCAQHDETTLEPSKARSYELPSLSGSESADLVMFLMSLEDPSNEVKQSIESAVAWFESSRMQGIRLERSDAPDAPRGFDYRVVEDANAPDLWARFYDLDTGMPYYSDRDGVKVDSIDKIGVERRTGYAWLRPFGRKVLNAYPQWAQEHGLNPDPAAARAHP